MAEVSVSEVKAMKVASEAKITQILTQLQDNTGVRINSVDVSIILGVAAAYPTTHISLQI